MKVDARPDGGAPRDKKILAHPYHKLHIWSKNCRKYVTVRNGIAFVSIPIHELLSRHLYLSPSTYFWVVNRYTHTHSAVRTNQSECSAFALTGDLTSLIVAAVTFHKSKQHTRLAQGEGYIRLRWGGYFTAVCFFLLLTRGAPISWRWNPLFGLGPVGSSGKWRILVFICIYIYKWYIWYVVCQY